jgi:YebC/PmpR family DNA-binding regulatory protein
MSGHSHWATIKHKKGATDARRGKLWSKLSRAIIIAAKNGGGDPTMNLKLRYAIDKARQVSMPRDNIERAIKRGTGEGNTETFDEITYEGFGPGGVAVLVEVLTDNRNRTGGEVRKVFERGGGNMGAPGCVGYLFERKGVLTVSAVGVDEDTLMALALDVGAEDMSRDGDVFEVICDPGSFTKVQEALAAGKVLVTSAELPMRAKVQVDAPDLETAMKACRLVEALNDHDDVQEVYSNLNMTSDVIAELSK